MDETRERFQRQLAESNQDWDRRLAELDARCRRVRMQNGDDYRSEMAMLHAARDRIGRACADLRHADSASFDAHTARLQQLVERFEAAYFALHDQMNGQFGVDVMDVVRSRARTQS